MPRELQWRSSVTQQNVGQLIVIPAQDLTSFLTLYYYFEKKNVLSLYRKIFNNNYVMLILNID